jgi:hypothetical protein
VQWNTHQFPRVTKKNHRKLIRIEDTQGIVRQSRRDGMNFHKKKHPSRFYYPTK